MSDSRRTKVELVEELEELRARVKEIEAERWDRDRAEKALRESEERFRQLAENVREVFWLHDCSSDKIIYVSPAYESVWGRLRRDLYRDSADWLAAVLPEDRPKVEDSFARQKGGEAFEEEYRIVRPDGSIRWIHDRGFPIRDDAGQVYRIAGIAEDVTDRRRAEETLRDSEARQRLILRSLPMALYTADVPSEFAATWVSEQIEDISGFSPRRWLEQAGFWASRLHPDDRERVLKEYSAVLTENIVATEYRWRCADGTYRWFLDQAVLVRDEQGNPKEAIGTWLDITERKKVEENLRLQARILENMAEGVNLVRVSDARIVYTNPTLERMFGYDSGELLNKHISILNAPAGKSRRETVKDIIRVLKKSGVWSGEVHNVKKDGTRFWCRANVTTFDHPEYGPVWVSVQQDITERKRAEEALRESEEKYRGLFDQAADSILLIDHKTGALAEFNDQAHQNLGYTREEFRNLTIADVEVVESAEEVAAHIQKILERGSDTFETKHRTKDGEIRDVLVNAKVIWIHGREFFQTIWTDITERKRAEEVRANLEAQLRQAQKMEAVGTLASGIAHDFTNLLTAIFGYTDLAKATLPDDHPAIRALEMVEHSAMQARGVTESLLTFSHRRGTEKRPIDLVKTVGDTLRLLRRVMSPSIDVTQELSGEGDVWVNADAIQIQQILMNLAVNGRDAMPDGGTLGVSLSRESTGRAMKGSTGVSGDRAEAVLVVADTGTGMTDETHSRIFEPFFTTKPRGQGTGLGMSIIHGIVTDCGGQIDIATRPGRGTRVTVRLPCCAPPKKTADRPSRQGEARGNGEVIVIVEDDEHVRSIMTSTLRSRGYQVLSTADGADALAALEANQDSVRLVILDVDSPDGDGIKLLRKARRMRTDIPFVVVTGSMECDPAEELTELDCLLRKPFQMSGLTSAVARVLSHAARPMRRSDDRDH